MHTHVHTLTCKHTCPHMCSHRHKRMLACTHMRSQTQAHMHTCTGTHALTHTCAGTCVLTHVRMHTYAWAHVSARTHACVCTCMGTCVLTHMHGHIRALTHAWAHMCSHMHVCTCMGARVFTRMRTCTCMGTHMLTHTHMHTRLPTLPTPTAPCRCRLPADSPRSRRVVSAHMVDPWQRQAVETLRGRGEGRKWPGLSTGWAGCCFSHPSLTPEDGGLQRARDRPGVCRPQVSQAPRRPTYHPASNLPSQISPSSRREGPLSRACALCHPKITT